MSFKNIYSVAAGVDSPHHPLAGEPCVGANHAHHAAETRGLP